MLLHDRFHQLGPVNDSWLNEHGTLGVNVFFAISGILICSRLLDEEARNGRISLRSFYIRRAFRILPPALLFLLVAAILIATGHTDATWQRWFSALFFCRNFFPLLDAHAQSWIVAHYWSLSLEEQFYLIFPAILVFSGRWRTRTMVAIVAVGLIWSSYLAHHDPTIPGYRPDIALNVLFVPALAAILLRKRNYGKWITAITRPWPIYLLLIVLSQSPTLTLRRGWVYHGHFYAQSLAFLMTALVLSTALHPNIWLSRFLEWAPLRWVGRISYSLYLWQQLFMTQHFAPAESIGWVYRHGLDWPMTFLCAALSYYLLERPFIRLGHRFTKNPVPGRPGDFDPPPTLQAATVS
jgi:peptidoglycan/LPS O-acetylase OafA/YrhL